MDTSDNKGNYDNIISQLAGENFSYEILTGGLVATTLLLSIDTNSYVLQLFDETVANQAAKKFYIYGLLEDSDIKTPKAIKHGVINQHTYLLTSVLEGNTLRSEFDSITIEDRMLIMREIGSNLRNVHSVNVGNSFGWIEGDHTHTSFHTIEEYLKSEMDRIGEVIKQNAPSETWVALENLFRSSISVISTSRGKPVLSWYDIQPDNILIKLVGSSFIFSGFLDPGAARFGIPEWDIAHAKLHLCKDEESFQALLLGYGSDIDLSLVNSFIPIVIADDLALGYSRKWDFVINESLIRLEKILPGEI